MIRHLHRSLGAHWKGFTLGLVVLGAGGPAAWLVRPVILPERPAVAMAPGDTVVVYGPRQLNGTTGSGTTYVERFTIALVPGRKYELKLVNGVAGGNSNRVTSAVTKLNGFQVIGTTDLTSSLASVTKVVAVRQIDTLRVTVVGPAGSFVTATVSSLASSEFLVNGPADYGIPSGTTKTYSFSFTKAASAGAPFRLYLTNGDSLGGLRVTNASVVLNGTTVVTTTEFTNAIGSLTKTVTLTATNNVTVTLKGNAARFVTLWFTATDITPPVVAITNPPADSAARTSPITVRGTLSDASPTRVTVNGVQATVTNNTSYSASVPLSTQGNNLLTAIATDAGGLTSQATRNVIFDSQAPALTVTAPADNSATKNATVAVTGSFTDATAVTVRTNGTSLTVTGSTFSGSVALAVGANVLTTTATDIAGNATSVVRNVTRDTIPPALTVSAPAEGATGADSITVSGTVTDGTAVTVATNGVSLVVTGTTFSGKVALASGANTLTTTATDAAGNVTSVVRHVTGDNSPPVLTVSAPLEGAVTRLDSITVIGTVTDASAVTVATNGTALPVTGTSFTGKVALAVGANTLTTTATDAGGSASSVIRHVTRDTMPPHLSLFAPPAPHSVTSEDSVRVVGTVSDETAVTVESRGVHFTIVSGGFDGKVPLFDGENTILITATDAAGNTTVGEAHVLKEVQLPPDPETVATPVDPSIATTTASATSFLYSGSNPIQTGVAPGTIVTQRAGVIRGKVLDRDGNPLHGVKVTILNHPELGQTISRQDGMFDLAVNAGAALVVQYSMGGYLPLQREARTEWQEYTPIDSVAMTQVDPAVTVVSLPSPSGVARGSAETDEDGSRRPTLIFESGTTATMLMPDMSTQPLSTLHVRATEFTVGNLGEAAMPGTLPPATAYTYAAELSADEAIAAGAVEVQFTKPVAFYLENFLDVRVGTRIPLGNYDRTLGRWVAENDGRVVKILSITGGAADLDVSGSGQPASQAALDSLGINPTELQQLAGIYSAGQTLWRTEHSHFSDWNWAWGPPPKSSRPQADPKPGDEPCDCPKKKTGWSTINIEGQSLGEAIAVTGTPFSLRYESNRMLGNTTERRITIPAQTRRDTASITGTSPIRRNEYPSHVVNVSYELSVAGRRIPVRPTNDQIPGSSIAATSIIWDGKDAYGRTLNGRQPASLGLSFVYEATYMAVASDGLRSFGTPGGGNIVAADQARRQVILTQLWEGELGSWDNRGQGLGGWSLDVQHSYDPIGGILQLGTGERVEARVLGNTITRFAGTGITGFSGDGGPALNARINGPTRIALGADGSLYLGDSRRIRRVAPNGIITTVAGSGSPGSGGDGGPATAAQLSNPIGLAIGSDGSIYIADAAEHRIRRVGPNGIISTVAGTGTSGFSGDGGPATAARLNFPKDVAVASDGTLYIADAGNNRVRRVGPDGTISTLAGTGANGFNGTDIPARTASVALPSGLALAPDGTLYIADQNNGRIRKVGVDGIIRHVAGGEPLGSAGDGKPANDPSVRMRLYEGMAVGPDGSLYIADNGLNGRVRRIGPDGIINTVAGIGISGCDDIGCPPTGDGGLALQARLYSGQGVAVGPDGALYVAGGDRIRVVRPGLPGLSVNDMLIASPSGAEVYQFDAGGKHRTTRNALTGDTLLAFGYNPTGQLVTVTDADGNVTTVERNGSGQPTAVVGPFGQRTTLSLDGQGYLAGVTNPKGEVVRLYNSSLGLLDSLADPRGKVHKFEYDARGRLTKDSDPVGGSQTLVRTEQDTSYTVTVSSQIGRTAGHKVIRLPTGATQRVITAPTGLATTQTIGLDGSTATTTPDGNTATFVKQGDPRWGMQASTLKSFTIQTPAGLLNSITAVRRATLSDTANPLTILSQLDSLVVNGQVFTTSYDAATRRTTSTTPEGRQSISRTDITGRLVSERTVGLDSVSYSYDAQGRLGQVRSGGRTWAYSYDASGRLKSTLDPLGRRDSLFYDTADRLTRHVLPGGREVLFAYDSSGNVTAVTPPGRPAHGFGYTPIDLANNYTPPNVGLTTPATTYQYNADRQLTRMTRPDSLAVVFDYDTAGRPSAVTFDRGQLTYGYSATTGNLTSITAPGSNTLSYTYDGTLPKTATWGGAVQGSVGVSYNSDFRVTGIKVGTDSVGFGYDRDGLLTAAGALGIKRNPQHGLPDRDSVNTVKSAWSYTPRGALSGYTATSGGATLFQTGYVRDSLDRITQLTETIDGATHASAFVYDSAGRLQEVRRDGVVTATYEYDGNGNRLHLTTPSGTINGTYDAQDRLTTYGANSYTYGSNGELKTKTDANGTTSYTYDALGNLTGVTLPDGTQIAYVIDGQNRRVGKRINGVLVQGFLYQGQLSPVAELDGNQQVVSRFVYGTRRNVPDYMVKTGITYRLVADHLGSVRLVVNVSDGTIAQRLDYDEFGRVLSNSSPGFQPFGFAGGLLETQTGLVHFGARDYDPSIGRWISKDPLGFDGADGNLYTYVGNDPVTYLDPTGLKLCQDDFERLKKYAQPEVVDKIVKEGISAFLRGGPEESVRFFKHNPRYILDSDRGWIDLQHVSAAAGSTLLYGPTGTWVNGLLFEAGQRVFGYPKSSFAPEDLRSNEMGIGHGILTELNGGKAPSLLENENLTDVISAWHQLDKKTDCDCQ